MYRKNLTNLYESIRSEFPKLNLAPHAELNSVHVARAIEDITDSPPAGCESKLLKLLGDFFFEEQRRLKVERHRAIRQQHDQINNLTRELT